MAGSDTDVSRHMHHDGVSYVRFFASFKQTFCALAHFQSCSVHEANIRTLEI